MNKRTQHGVWSHQQQATAWFTSVLFSDPPHKMLQAHLPALQSVAHSKISLWRNQRLKKNVKKTKQEKLKFRDK